MKVELVYLKHCNVIWLNREYIYEQPIAGSLIVNTSWWGKDAAQVQSTEEVCRRV